MVYVLSCAFMLLLKVLSCFNMPHHREKLLITATTEIAASLQKIVYLGEELYLLPNEPFEQDAWMYEGREICILISKPLVEEFKNSVLISLKTVPM